MERQSIFYPLIRDSALRVQFKAGEFWISSVIIWQMLQAAVGAAAAAAAKSKILGLITEMYSEVREVRPRILVKPHVCFAA